MIGNVSKMSNDDTGNGPSEAAAVGFEVASEAAAGFEVASEEGPF